jgi:hypothetical protein
MNRDSIEGRNSTNFEFESEELVVLINIAKYKNVHSRNFEYGEQFQLSDGYLS